jgi:hypothetical protein
MANSGKVRVPGHQIPDVDGEVVLQEYTGGSQHVTTLPGSVKRISAATYNTTDVNYVEVLVLGTGSLTLSPKSGDTDVVVTNAELTSRGFTLPFYGPFDSVTAGTGMEILVYVP